MHGCATLFEVKSFISAMHIAVVGGPHRIQLCKSLRIGRQRSRCDVAHEDVLVQGGSCVCGHCGYDIAAVSIVNM
jgi:hypothetical protein